MKKAKNIILLSGIIFNLLYIVLQLFRFVYDCVTVVLKFGFDNLRYFVYNDFFPSLITIALMILPVLLLISNLKNKAGKVLPIISAVMCGAIALVMVFSFVTPAIPQYLIYSKLGLVDTYFTIILHFITSGGILLFTGFALLTVGSIMSLIKSKE